VFRVPGDLVASAEPRGGPVLLRLESGVEQR
jgi:hypothetical protein